VELVDIASERSVIAGILQNNSDIYYDILDLITNETFTTKSNRVLWEIIQYIYANDPNAKIDYSLIESAGKSLKLDNILDDIEEQKYIRSLYNRPIARENIRKIAIKIRKLEIARGYRDKLQLSIAELCQITGDEPLTSIINIAEKPIFEFSDNLSSTDTSDPVMMGNNIGEYIDHLKDNPKENIGVSTGYPLYDSMIGGGIRRGTVGLIGARTKAGKSTLANNVALYVSEKLNIPVLFLDTEMVVSDQRHRALANLSNVDIYTIETGKFGKDENKLKSVKGAAKKLSKIPYYHVSAVGKPIEEILAIARRWLLKIVGKDENGITKDCLILYDYLKLANTDDMTRTLQEYQLLGFQIGSLHNFCVTHSVPCLSFIQLNRDGINKESSDVVSGSDRQAWICSHFCIFKHKSDEEIAQDGITKGNRKMVFVLGRHGGGLDQNEYVCMQMDGQYNRITEVCLNTDNTDNSGFQESVENLIGETF
jgi:replicative DNA helicase